MEHTIVVAATAAEPAVAPVHRAVRGLRHGRVLHVRGAQGHPRRVRRPLAAGQRLPAALAAPAPAPRARGVSRGRVLPPLAPPGARGAPVQRDGRRLPHRPSPDRDPGRGGLRLHPDERHLHHRRADLPPHRPVQRGHPARHRRRAVRVPRRAATRRSRR